MATTTLVAKGIYRIDFGDVKGADNGEILNCALVFIIVSPDGKTAIIDCSPSAVVVDLLDSIRSLGHEPDLLSSIILTHIHLDHAGAAGLLATKLPQVKIVVHSRGANHLCNPAKLIAATQEAFGAGFEKDYGVILAVPEAQLQAVDDGDIIQVGSRTLKIIYTPGHATHHICIYDNLTGSLFSGDSLGHLDNTNHPVIIVAGFDLQSSLDSIEKMQSLNPKHIFSAHGTYHREPGELLQSVKDTTRDYGDIILKALQDGKKKAEIETALINYQLAHRLLPDGITHDFESVLPHFTAYFKRMGLV